MDNFEIRFPNWAEYHLELPEEEALRRYEAECVQLVMDAQD